jgi:hypothetical protein
MEGIMQKLLIIVILSIFITGTAYGYNVCTIYRDTVFCTDSSGFSTGNGCYVLKEAAHNVYATILDSDKGHDPIPVEFVGGPGGRFYILKRDLNCGK